MRSGTIIAIIVAIVVVVGAVFWYQSSQPGLEDDMATEPIMEDDAAAVDDPALPEDDTALPADDPALPEEDTATAPDPATDEDVVGAQDGTVDDDPLPGDEPPAEPPADDGTAGDTAAGTTQDDPEVIGDEVTDDAIVVESETDDAVVMGAEDSETSVDIVEDDTATGTATTPTTDTGVATAGASADPEELLTPANFDQDEVLALIEESEELTEQQRSSLGALVEGADGGAGTVDAAITAVRDALGLPPLN